MQSTRKLKSAWLVTWESFGGHAAVPKSKKVAAILNYRNSPKKVRAFIEQLYIAHGKSSWDKLLAADSPRKIPCPAKFAQIDGISWEGKIDCGDNPWLHARMVNNLQVLIHANGREEVIWSELPILKRP